MKVSRTIGKQCIEITYVNAPCTRTTMVRRPKEKPILAGYNISHRDFIALVRGVPTIANALEGVPEDADDMESYFGAYQVLILRNAPSPRS
jgi:hypothetical protein